jgi:hypothetical protein
MICCSTNQKIVIDNRYKISKAPKWETDFLSTDSGSGMIIQFIKDKNVFRPRNIQLSLWPYPLDTVTTERKFYDVIQPLPSGGLADETYIDYQIKNRPIKFSIVVDSTYQTSNQIFPGTYYLTINAYGVSPNYLKDFTVKQNYWSVIKLRIYEEPVNWYELY